jgi:serine protease AprX
MRRGLRRGMLGLLAVALTQAVLGGAPVALGSGPRAGRVDRSLEQLAQQHPNNVVRVIVQGRRLADASQAVQRSAGRARARLPHVAGVAAEMRADQIDAVSRESGVERVMLDPLMNAVGIGQDNALSPASVFPQAVGAPALWWSGTMGQGVAIAVLDSGIQMHRDFGMPSRVIRSERFNESASSSADQIGHGTWVAGIAAGDGDSSNGRYVGVAPRASIVNLKVSDDSGATYASDVIQALGWVVTNHSAFNIRVVNLSFVSSVAEGYATNLLDAAVEMVWHSGVVVVVSAGNRGAGSLKAAPANDPYVITVGASDDMGTAARWDDALAWFSSHGLTQDDIPKPDLVAPGRHIVAALANSAQLAQQYPSKVVNQRYIQLSGTSAAAPVVSGAIALLLQERPQLKPDQVKWLLTRNARALRGSGDGAGELDIAAAAEYWGQVGRANLGLVPNRLLVLAYLYQHGQSGMNWDSVSWDSVSWDSVSWDSVSWDSVSWDNVSSATVSWDTVLGDD